MGMPIYEAGEHGLAAYVQNPSAWSGKPFHILIGANTGDLAVRYGNGPGTRHPGVDCNDVSVPNYYLRLQTAVHVFLLGQGMFFTYLIPSPLPNFIHLS